MNEIQMLAKRDKLQMVDGPERLELIVAPRDIKAAARKDARECAFSCAAKRIWPQVEAAWFYRSVAWLRVNRSLVRYFLPHSVQKEIVSFDRGAPVQPGIYYLSPPPARSVASRRAWGASQKGKASSAAAMRRYRLRKAGKNVEYKCVRVSGIRSPGSSITGPR